MSIVLDQNFYSRKETQIRYKDYIFNYLINEISVAKWNKIVGICQNCFDLHSKRNDLINDFLILVSDDDHQVYLNTSVDLLAENIVKRNVDHLFKCDQSIIKDIYINLIRKGNYRADIIIEREYLILVYLIMSRHTFDSEPKMAWNSENKKLTLFINYDIQKKTHKKTIVSKVV